MAAACPLVWMTIRPTLASSSSKVSGSLVGSGVNGLGGAGLVRTSTEAVMPGKMGSGQPAPGCADDEVCAPCTNPQTATSSQVSQINAVVKAELFPTNVRALGVGLPYAITVSLFGGTGHRVVLRSLDVNQQTDTGDIGIAMSTSVPAALILERSRIHTVSTGHDSVSIAANDPERTAAIHFLPDYFHP
mgnify:CR=1 FL=1